MLTRSFVFPTFEAMTAFLTHWVCTITTQNHHPDFSCHPGLTMVAVALTTQRAQALTQADLPVARALNAWGLEGAEQPRKDFPAVKRPTNTQGSAHTLATGETPLLAKTTPVETT